MWIPASGRTAQIRRRNRTLKFTPHPSLRATLSLKGRGYKRKPLLDALTDYQTLGRRRFHVPGHNGRYLGSALVPPFTGLTPGNFSHDLTELTGLDVLSEPSGCIAEAQTLFAEAYGVLQSYFLVNGSTAGILAALLAVLRPGDRLLVPRNVHRSVISALILSGAEPIWFLPEWISEWGLWGSVAAEQVSRLSEKHAPIRALVLTSPTYEGLGSDIGAISRICRERDIFLIVDEAHGSLWHFCPDLPSSAVTTSGDAVIQSLHKSGGSLTQSALAHLPKGSRILPEDFQQSLNLVQTTSPSYLLMASLEAARLFLTSPEGRDRLQFMRDQTGWLRQELRRSLHYFQLFEPEGERGKYFDPTKIYLKFSGESGERWADRMEAEGLIAYESASPFGVLYLAGLGLDNDDYQFFLTQFQIADKTYAAHLSKNHLLPADYLPVPLPETVLLPREAFFRKGIRISKAQALNQIAKETIVHCPPGVPVLVPGERIQAAHLPYLPEQLVVVHSCLIPRASLNP